MVETHNPKIFTKFKRFDNTGEQTDFEIKGNENLIIKGDNLFVLHSLIPKYKGKVDLIYIDPPYNTGREFNYNDNFDSSNWLSFMEKRLKVARELLHDNGSIYINIDYNEVHYLKVLMDEIFGRECFQREIIWRIGWISGFKTMANNYIRNHDTILYYTKNPNEYTFNKIYNTIGDYSERFNHNSKKKIEAYLKKFDIDEKEIKKFIEFISVVGLPQKYPLEDTWNSSIYDKLNSIAITSYSHEKVSKMLNVEEFKGQKSEQLLKRIIEVSTDEKDLVLDFFAGTGTTCAVAHKLNRRYIGIEIQDYAENIIVERLKKVIEGDKYGISKKVNWEGGGSFLYLELLKYNNTYINLSEIDNSLYQISNLDKMFNKKFYCLEK